MSQRRCSGHSFILTETLQGVWKCYSHFIDEKTQRPRELLLIPSFNSCVMAYLELQSLQVLGGAVQLKKWHTLF